MSAGWVFVWVLATVPCVERDEKPQRQNVPCALDLKQALALAKRHETFRLSEQVRKQAQADVVTAWSHILPGLSASGTYRRNNRRIIVVDREAQLLDSIEGSLVASITLFRGGTIPRLQAAKRAREAAEQEIDWENQQFFFTVAEAFLAAKLSASLERSAGRARDKAERLFRDTKIKVENGRALSLDASRAELEVLRAEETLQRARNNTQNSRALLQLLTQLPEPFEILWRFETSTEQMATNDASRRPDQHALALRQEELQTRLRASGWDYAPNLSAQATGFATSNGGFLEQTTRWFVEVTLSWELYDGGRRAAERERARADLNRNKLESSLLERTIRFERDRAQRDLETSQTTLTTVERQSEVAAKNLALTETQYKAGRATSLDVSVAQSGARAADTAVVVTQLQYAVARLNVLRSLGLSPLGMEWE